MANLVNGETILVWDSNTVSGDTYPSLWYQIFQSNGVAVGSATKVDGYPPFQNTDGEFTPSVVATSNGFVIVFTAKIGTA